MAYLVTLYNQHAKCAYSAVGRTRPKAFANAVAKAGEPFLREGGDKLTTLRTLFQEHLMTSYYRTSRHGYASHPIGCGVEFRRIQ